MLEESQEWRVFTCGVINATIVANQQVGGGYDAATEEFVAMLDAYLRWCRDIRIKGDLDYRSAMQYRSDYGPVA